MLKDFYFYFSLIIKNKVRKKYKYELIKCKKLYEY